MALSTYPVDCVDYPGGWTIDQLWDWSWGMLLIMTGRQKSWFWLTSAALVVNAALCLALVPMIGISGAAIGTSISVGGMNIAAAIIGKTKAGLWPYDRRFYKGILAGSLAAIAGFIPRLFQISDLVSLLACCILVTVVFLFTLKFLGLDKEDNQLFSEIFSRLK
jgi:O-antigen/teichoic acid export membrane protein